MRRTPLLAALASALVFASLAAATTFTPLSWEQLCDKAERVVLVRAVETTVEERGGIPTTLVTCRVLQTYRGDPVGSIVLRAPGGKRGELTMKIPGAPMPEIGDTFLALVARDGTTYRGRPVVRAIGLGQGMLAIVEKDGRLWAVQVIAGAPERFAACAESAAACRNKLGVLAQPLTALPALTAQP